MRVDETRAAGPFWRRLLWLVALWLAGVGTVGVVALLIRTWLLGG
ncbi:DUF2474 family protein [Xanthomonas sp. XNM01]|nr:DUF2474 family protein [Xanthomonas sp. XNM01]MBD9368429.1 DUF2474 family protein [Xanthomonas sp. XNM01]